MEQKYKDLAVKMQVSSFFVKLKVSYIFSKFYSSYTRHILMDFCSIK